MPSCLFYNCSLINPLNYFTKCLGVQQWYRDLIKFRVQQSINLSKLHQIYQDIILMITPTLTITPNPNCEFENFWLLVKQGLYFRYFGLLRKNKNIEIINLGHGVLLNPYITVGHRDTLLF